MQDHDFDTIAAQGVTVENYARMGATIDAGLKQIDRQLAPCAEDTTVLFCFGGNDCDYDWKAISADPDGEHLPHTPSERFIDGYCTAIRKARQAGARVAMTSLPPLEQSRYFSFITKGLSAENILRWLGDTDHLYRWQEYYNDMVTQLSRAFGAGSSIAGGIFEKPCFSVAHRRRRHPPHAGRSRPYPPECTDRAQLLILAATDLALMLLRLRIFRDAGFFVSAPLSPT